MIVCDFCLKELKQKPKSYKHTLYTGCGYEDLQLCDNCHNELIEKIKRTEAKFYQTKKLLLRLSNEGFIKKDR